MKKLKEQFKIFLQNAKQNTTTKQAKLKQIK